MTARTTTRLSTKGQVILPKAIRTEKQWDAGIQLIVEPTIDGVLLRPLPSAFPATRPDDVFGCLAFAGTAKSLAEMAVGIAAEIKRRHARGRY